MLEVRTITDMDDYHQLPRIQIEAWGFSDLDAEPHHLMTRVQKYGGLVQGLYEGGALIGFSYGLPGRWRGEWFLYSHMTAVRPGHQGRGHGLRLKEAQRLAARAMGFTRMRWNFDPLEALNCYFNLHRLGAEAGEYERNVYGEGSSGLHRGLPTDRLIALWRLDDPSLDGRLSHPLPRREMDMSVDPPPPGAAARGYLEIPADIRRLKVADPSAARRWQARVRAGFEAAFALGWVARGVVFALDGGRVFVELEPEQEG